MNDINPTTPQLKFVKAVSDAYLSHDLDKVKTFLSKDFTSQSFPKVAEYPDEAREEHLARWVSFFPLLTKSEVRPNCRFTAVGLISTRLGQLSRSD